MSQSSYHFKIRTQMKEHDLYGSQHPLVFRGVQFYRTCTACPEQYDAWFHGNQIGYVRLRWGSLRADYLECGGPVVYWTRVGQDNLVGEFYDDEERATHLIAIAEALKQEHEKVPRSGSGSTERSTTEP